MIEKLTGNLTPNRFIHVDSEEHTVLEQLGKMQPKINEVVESSNDHEKRIKDVENKKLNIFDYENDQTQNRKMSKKGNFTGSWFGIEKPEYAEPGIAGVVSKHSKEIDEYKIRSISNTMIPEYQMTFYKRIADDTDLVMKNDRPVEQEGLCHVGGNKFVTGFTCMNKPTSTSPTEIIEFDLTEYGKPKVLRSRTLYGLGKANTMCYANNKIYVVPSGWYENGSMVYTNQIKVLDYETLSIIDTIETPFSIVRYIASYEDELYILENTDNSIYKYDGSTFKKHLTLQNYFVGGAQGFDIYNDIVYVMQGYAYVIAMYDFKTGEKIKEVGFDSHTNNGHFFEYVADLTVKDGDVYITPHARGDLTQTKLDATDMKSNFSYYINYVCKLGFKTGNVSTNTIYYNFENRQLYVDTTLPENTYFATGSSSSPLKLLSEYFNNNLVKKDAYLLNTNADYLTYYGVLNLINTTFNTPFKIKCHALLTDTFNGSLRNIEIDSRNLNFRPFQFIRSTINSLNMTVVNNSQQGIISTSHVNNHVKITHPTEVSNSYVKYIDNSSNVIKGISPFQKLRYTASDVGDEHVYTLNVDSSFVTTRFLFTFKYKTVHSFTFLMETDVMEDLIFNLPQSEGGTSMTIKYDSTTKQLKFKGVNSNNIRQLSIIPL